MRCDLCGSSENVATYGVHPPEYSQKFGARSTDWWIDEAHFFSQHYCEACIEAARKKNVRHAAALIFLPTVGMMRLWKFKRCTKEEMGDLMAASVCAHERNPLEKHILWPLGAEGFVSLENHLTREGVAKRARKEEKWPETIRSLHR
jgi:hypothetical protein